jgi:hypothetical protein
MIGAAAIGLIEETVAIEAIEGIVAIAATVRVGLVMATTPKWWRNSHGNVTAKRRRPPPVLSPSQELPVLRFERTEDRL